MLPARSVTNMRPSGANAMSQGNRSPDCTTVVASCGALPVPTGTPGTVIVRKTPSSSIHHAPSTTGRRCSEYEPAVLGARTWKVKVAVAPGGTACSAWAATRVLYGQFTASGAHWASSRLMPSRASSPSTPLFQVREPVFRKTTLSGWLVCPGCSVGYADWLTHRLWNPRSETTSTKTPSSSRCCTPSSTGWSGSRYGPGLAGARSTKVNVAIAPVTTVLSTVVVTRFAFIQPTAPPASAKAV